MTALRVLIGCETSGIARRAVPGFPGYFATAEGEIVSCLRGKERLLKRRPHRNGYNLVTLCRSDGVRLDTTLHRVIAMAFHPNPASLPCVRHLDGEKSNCRPENLAWGTYADNEADKIITGTRRYGTARMKLNAAARMEIKAAAAAGVPVTQLATKFGVDRSTITRLLAGTTWSNRRWPMADEAAKR